MAKRRKATSPPSVMTTAQLQRRQSAQLSPSLSSPHSLHPTPKEINAAFYLENAQLGRPQRRGSKMSTAVGIAGAVIHTAIPALLSTGVMVALIFGGCCSNVFALEAIVKEDPGSGLLITLVQFVFTAFFSYPQQFSSSGKPPFFLKPNAVPLSRWMVSILLFFAISVLNNFAFGYNISVPVHIILRSGGSVTTMALGWFWGKRYTRVQVFSVALLTVGIIIAAMSDAQAKGRKSSASSEPTVNFVKGLVLLFIAQVLAAFMGLFIESTYSIYGRHWRENLFYSHFLSIPLFLVFLPALKTQYHRLADSPPLATAISTRFPDLTKELSPATWTLLPPIPTKIMILILNALTQYACIRGVNLLAARSTALTVTIVLNIRKLVSLFLSIILFSNKLAPGVILGAVVVFGSGGIYAWESQRQRYRHQRQISGVRRRDLNMAVFGNRNGSANGALDKERELERDRGRIWDRDQDIEGEQKRGKR
ncbi:MAG: hypothetical protein M1819_005021 [Sarea resinae]|nr:MAG: hypothetical protein M1819_005021 [Sarea resinae]